MLFDLPGAVLFTPINYPKVFELSRSIFRFTISNLRFAILQLKSLRDEVFDRFIPFDLVRPIRQAQGKR